MLFSLPSSHVPIQLSSEPARELVLSAANLNFVTCLKAASLFIVFFIKFAFLAQKAGWILSHRSKRLGRGFRPERDFLNFWSCSKTVSLFIVFSTTSKEPVELIRAMFSMLWLTASCCLISHLRAVSSSLPTFALKAQRGSNYHAARPLFAL